VTGALPPIGETAAHVAPTHHRDLHRLAVSSRSRGYPELTVIAGEHFSASIPERLLAGDLDIGLALHPQPVSGVESELLRSEPVTALLSKRHRLADADSISLGELRDEPLLLFPRQLAPAYYDRIVAACEGAGFQPRIQTFQDPPVNAMLARLPGGREIGLTPASFAIHAADAGPDIVARKIVDPVIQAELSIVWPARAPSAAVAHFLDSARRCATNNNWVAAPGRNTRRHHPRQLSERSCTARNPVPRGAVVMSWPSERSGIFDPGGEH
jgi:DNA-binding transcriptional LysR family regulator